MSPLRALVLCCSLKPSPASVGDAEAGLRQGGPKPDTTGAATATLAANAAHLARLLSDQPYS
jgi:hypothetical protein